MNSNIMFNLEKNRQVGPTRGWGYVGDEVKNKILREIPK
jgi:hypothetical protein